MKGMKSFLVALPLVAMLSAAALAAEIKMEPLPAPEGLSALPVAPWVKAGDDSWKEGKPLFDIADSTGEKETAAKGWVAVGKEAILIHIVVTDDKHINNKSGGDIWQGDSIQMSVDALGNGMDAGPSGRGTTAVGYALTDKGLAGWVWQSSAGNANSAIKTLPVITRDDAAKTTTYDITLPWADLQTVPGVAPTIGLTVQINDSDSENALEQTRIYWPKTEGNGRNRRTPMGRIALGKPTEETFASNISRSSIWRSYDYVEFTFAAASDKPLSLIATLDDQKQQLDLPAIKLSDGVQRYVVRAFPQKLPEKPMAFKATLTDASGKVLTEAQTAVQSDASVFDEMNRRIDELAAHSPNPLFTRHLHSIQAVANGEWQLAKLSLDKSTTMAENAAKDVRTILKALDGDAAKWDTYLGRQRKLVMAFMAKDRSLQFYSVTLPKNWDPGKTYPMVVFLHGSGGSTDALDGAVGPFEGDLVSKPAVSRFDGDFDMIYLEPFARGNYGYKDVAEDDVYRSIDDVTHMLKVDPDRTYLTGFSLGGMGTWGIMLRTPDRWAAVVINAGGPAYAPVGIGLGRNAIGLPVRISHGDADRSVPIQEGREMLKELKDCGADAEFIVHAGVGHEYYEKPWEADNLGWLLTHKRTRPNHFAFLADTNNHLGRNGITIRRDVTISPTPWFDCTIEGNEVRIKSQGANRLDVNLGEGGLGLDGDVKVIWNGKASYEGPAKKITLSNGKERRIPDYED